ncbi:2-amino-4-hydroxy-6-hydroxymethyldihydropteridine diphosphokinase [Planctomicrobium sp. SH664]|uniref:2-amino-4-hydroxy-6- hydroxymethyldihydropteridine diphosphokinase n=1 Tax=Planctomicrobium sp. SH664 TaxID=3448125 RepID=UPI003F5AFC46
MTESILGESRVFVALGSNIDPERHLPAAVRKLRSIARVLKVSSVWESEPVGYLQQARFCNAAVLLTTDLPPERMHSLLRRIESDLGRVRDPDNKNAPRTIDLDIAIYEDVVVSTPLLTIPDPAIRDRPFLAVPLAELDANFWVPLTGHTLGELALLSPGRDQLVPRPDLNLGGAGLHD